MDNRWRFAAKHGWSSAIGFCRLFASEPRFSTVLLSRRLQYFFTRRLKSPLLTPKQFLIDTPDALIAYWSMFVERELHDASWVSSLLEKKAPLVVDVGANAGVFSHYVHCLRPDAEFVAFEPLPSMVARLNGLKSRTGINLCIRQQAVSSSCGQAWFESEHGYDGTSRLSITQGSAGNRFQVETTTLDTALGDREIAVMKIDVEGFECEVIRGGAKALAKTDFVIMESEEREHLSRVSTALGKNWESKKVGSTDYLFTRLR